MCPRTVFPKEWKSGDMSLSVYTELSKYFDRVQSIHLQGWGEPFLHPELFHMIQIAKLKNCSVSLTTNGVLLTPDISEKLVREKVDIIALSVAGGSKETHEKIRSGSNFEIFCRNIKSFNEIKQRMKSKIPKLVLSFLMTKINLGELPQTVDLAKDLGINEMVATNLDYTPSKLQDDLRVFSCHSNHTSYNDLLDTGIKRAKKVKLPLRVYPLTLEEVVMCEMNPLQIIFFSHDGCVSPCVYLNMTRQGSIPRTFCGSHFKIQRNCFGNINEDDFIGIWESHDYKTFRKFYYHRLNAVHAIYRDIKFEIASTDKINEMEKALEKVLSENPIPLVCKSCYKAYNI
jgi:MoaA/NifB/PqqE/SkfB family radical SAM enzyme